MRSSACVILDPKKISEIREELDTFIGKNSENPFLVSIFIKQTMESALRKDTIPIVLFFRTKGRIIGVVPLLISKRFGIRFAAFLFDFWFSPDFIFDLEYNEVCMQNTLSYLFDNLKCQFATFDLPAESSNLRILEKICKTKRVSVHRKHDVNFSHGIISVNFTWNDFQKSRGKYFRQEFRRIERKLNSAGKWRVLFFENHDKEEDVLRKIVEIERVSWKQNWRSQQNLSVDTQLIQLWEGGSIAIEAIPTFKRSVWFLELNGNAIAYSLVVEYKGTAYIAKTSYNYEYRKLYPGVYVVNATVRDLFNCERVKTIDFLTNQPFVKKWSSTFQLRYRFLLRKGFLPNLFMLLSQQQKIRVMWRAVPKLVRQLVLA